MKKKMFRSALCLLCAVFLLPGAAFAETEEGYSDPVVPVEESMQLFAYLSETELMAASGAGGWEGTLKINADGTFTGDYHDSDFDMISVVSFSGRFIPSGTERRGSGNYALWVEDLTTEQTPGTEGKDEYGDRIVYTEAPLYDREYVLVTLPGTPDAEIPEMVRGEIGGTFDVWQNYSGYITLTRDDGWGFFAEPSRRWEGPASAASEEGTDIGDPASTGPAENPSEELPKYTTRLSNGNLRYDDGLIAFEMPGDAIPFRMSSKETSGTVFPEGTETKEVAVLIPSPADNPDFRDYIWTETQKPYLVVVRVGPVQLPEGTNAEEFAWTVFPDGETTGYATVKGRIARYKSYKPTGMPFLSNGDNNYLIPLTGNRILWIEYGNYSDPDRSSALQLFLDTLEIRDDLYAVPPDGTAAAPSEPAAGTAPAEEPAAAPEEGTDIGDPASTVPEEGTAPAETPAEEAAPAAEPAPAQDGWSGYWMTRDDSLSELVITPNGDGTLHAEVFFLKTLNMHATLTPQDDRNMRFETDYGALIGTLTRQEDGTLSLKLSGGYSFNDEEASEYNEYYARTFMYYPAAYEEMWYEDPAQASAGSDEDWLGSWTVKKGDRQADLLIERNGSSLWARITLSNGLYFTSPLEPSGDNVMDFNEEGGYYCMLRLNRKLRMIVMEEIGAEQESVYDWLYAFPYSIVEFRRLGAGLDVPDELQQPNDAAEHVHTLPGQDTADAGIGTPARTDESNGTPSASQPRQAELQPIPGRDGYMQVPVSRVDATSYIRGKDDATAYAPFRMTDGVETTAFQFSTKITPLGGAWMYFDFDAPVRLDELWIKNGFWKKTDGKDQYTRNCRIKKMAVFVLREDTGEEELVAEVTLKDDKTRKDWQVIPLNGAENVIGVSIRVDSVYKGTKFKTDVCVSEIMFVQATGQ